MCSGRIVGKHAASIRLAEAVPCSSDSWPTPRSLAALVVSY